MQFFSTVVTAIIATAAMILVIAEQEVNIKLHVSRDKLYVTPFGKQCYYNSCIDPTMYPCAKGVCVLQNYAFGRCDNMEGQQDYSKFKCPFPNPYSN